MIGFLVLGAVALAALAAGGWWYVMSNVEKPEYQVVEKDGDIEIRAYPPLVVAEVTREGARKPAIESGFRALAAYIFAKDRAGEGVAMTAPVTQQSAEIPMTAPVTQSAAEGGSSQEGPWVVRFIMPSGYTLESLPTPARDDVTLKALDAGRKAAIQFSGRADTALLEKKESELRSWLEARGLAYDEPATYAFYNDPFTPGPLRRNEVLFDLVETP